MVGATAPIMRVPDAPISGVVSTGPKEGRLSMSETDPKKTAKQSRADDVRTKIAAVAANATATDRRIVADILTRAATGEYGSSTFDITPGVAALLFLEHNPHNRDFDPG